MTGAGGVGRDDASSPQGRPDDGGAPRSDAFARLYAELRERAHGMMRGQPAHHTLQTTALVHEAWMRVRAGRTERTLEDAQFLGLAASAMRSVLVDHARARTADKRGGGALRVELGSEELLAAAAEDTLLEVDQALERLAALDPLLARVAEMRLFGGLEHQEAAQVLGVSTRTVERAWTTVRAWMRRELSQGQAP